MRIEQLLSISFFTMACIFTLYFIMDRIRLPTREGFTDSLDELTQKIQAENEPVPTDADAVSAHQTLLRYMRNDFSKGIRFAQDFGKRFFGDNLPFRQDLDTRKLMDNYRSPLQ